MILALLRKYGRVLLDVLIVLGIVLIIFVWNPWNIFGGGLKLHQTANNVTSVQKIGQLVTAEYYGETISTIDQSRLRLIYSDDVNARADLLFVQIKQELLANHAQQVLNDIQEEEKTPKIFRWLRFSRKSKRHFKKAIKESDLMASSSTDASIVNDSLYQPVMEYYWRHQKQSRRKMTSKPIDAKDLSDALWLLTQEITSNLERLDEQAFETWLNQGLPGQGDAVFTDFYYAKKDAGLTNREQKKKLSMIGRGWVKAGFNFETLDERHFILDKERGAVHLFGVKAEILDADINPWFIPEKQIPGFQLLEYNNKVDFEDAKLVKRYCVEKLRKKALDAGILEQAELLGKESVKSFISLVSGIEIKEVYFHYDRFSVITKEVLKDEFISYEEALLVEQLISQQVDSILTLDAMKVNYKQNQQLIELNQQRLTASIHHLKSCWFEKKNQYYNRFASTVHRITADSILTTGEFKEIETLKRPLNKVLHPGTNRTAHTLAQATWFSDPYETIREYNAAIDTIINRTNYYGDIRDTILVNDVNTIQSLLALAEQTTIVSQTTIKDSIAVSYVLPNNKADQLNNLRYPFSVPSQWKSLLHIHKKEGVTTIIVDSLDCFVFTSIPAKIKQLQLEVEKSDTTGWQVKTCKDKKQNPLNWPVSAEERQLINDLINHQMEHQPGFFTQLSNRMQTVLNPDSLQKKHRAFRNNMKQLFK